MFLTVWRQEFPGVRYVLKVSDSGILSEENYVRQNISVDFQSNSLPVLVDANGELQYFLQSELRHTITIESG